jgi:hypothetical protein
MGECDKLGHLDNRNRFVKELQPSVLDTMAVWYLSIIGSTAKVAMPMAPQLRNIILSQSG